MYFSVLHIMFLFRRDEPSATASTQSTSASAPRWHHVVGVVAPASLGATIFRTAGQTRNMVVCSARDSRAILLVCTAVAPGAQDVHIVSSAQKFADVC